MSKFDIEEVQLALEGHQRRAVRTERETRTAAVAAVLRDEPSGRAPELLFIRRAEHPGDPWSGHMAFPGGRVDPGDASPFAAALRETREEISLDLVSEARHLGDLSPVPAVAKGKPVSMVIHPFVFAVQGGGPPLTPDPSEVAEALWIPLELFFDPSARETLDYEYEGARLQLPCYRWQGRTVWGLTLKMIDELTAALRALRSDVIDSST
ncbi:MAG: CoA pyrophosphatase [Myxococcota bacterium]